MSEELRIDVDIQTKDDKARSQLNNLIQEYSKKTIDFDVKLGQFDITGLSRSIARLTSDLNALSNIEFTGLNKLETNLKNINKLMDKQNSIQNKGSEFESNTTSNIKRLIGDQEESLKEINKLDDLGKELQHVLDSYNKNNEIAFKGFVDSNKNALTELDKLKNSSSTGAFQRILQYKKEMEKVQNELRELGVKPKVFVEKTFTMDSGKVGIHKYNGGYEDLIGMSEERFKKNVEKAKEVSKRVSQLKKNIETNLKKVSDDEKEVLQKIENMQKDIGKPNAVGNESNLNYISMILESYMNPDDLKDLDFRFTDDIFKGFDRFLNSIKEMKREFNDTFGKDNDTVNFDLFDNVQKVVDGLDKTMETVNLDSLKDKLTKAFDIDEKVISNIEKIENALKQLNSMSDLTQKSLFDTSRKTGAELELDKKIKEYLAIDKSVNDAMVKMSKAQLTGSNEVANSLSREIDLLRQKQSLVAIDIKRFDMSDDLKEQIKLQEDLNKAISDTSKIEFKSNFINQAHEDALKLNKEFDEIHDKQKKMTSFEMPEIVNTKDLKSYVDYLDSAEDGLKRIITQYTNVKGVDLVTTLYGDGTEVRKIVGNIEKATNELSTAYKQADNELTKLIKTQQQMEFKGDTNSVKLLDDQISKWKDVKSSIEDAARQTKVYDQMIEKSQATLMKNKTILDSNESKIEFRIDVDNDKALQKFDEFKTRSLSSIQEIERKFKGTNLFGDASQEADKLRNKLKEVEDSIQGMDHIDLSKLSTSMRSFNQELTQTKRDLNDLNKSMKDGFFSNFGDEFKSNLISFTAGELLADGIREVGQSLKTLVMEYDTAMANLKKVANPADIMNIDQLDAIQSKAVGIAKNVGMASQDVIQAISDTIQMGGYGMDEATKIAEQTMMLANVAEMTQEAASQGIVTMMSAFDLNPMKEIPVVVDGVTKSTDELTDSMDKLNYVGNNFAISSSGILEAITSGANVLAEYGVSMNDTIAMITGANVTLQDPAKVGNGLKTIAINLAGIKTSAKDGSLELNKTAKALDEIAGIDVFADKKTGQLKDMAQIMEELSSKWDTFTEAERAGISEAIAGKQQAAVFQSLMSNFDTVKQVQSELNQGWHFGSALAENEQYVDSLSGKLNKLKETWVGIFNTIFNVDSTKGMLDGLISISEAIASVVEALDEMGILTPVLVGSIGGLFSAFNKNTSVLDLFKNANKEMGLMNKGASLLKGGMDSLGSGIVSAGKFLANFVAQGLLIGGVTLLVTGLAKAWDEMAHGLENAEKEIKNTIESLNNSIQQDTQDLKFLEDTEKRYNELIKKKEEYSKIPLESMTDEQLADMRELEQITSDLAKMFPELVIGYDGDGRPIMLMADDMETLKQRTQEQIELNKELLRIKREELAENSRKQVQEGEFFGFGSGVKEQMDTTKAISNSLYDSLKSNEEQYTKAVIDGNDRRANKLKKTIDAQKQQLDVHYKENLALYQEYTQKELEVQQSAFDQIQTIKGYDKLDENAMSQVQSFMDGLNWINMDESQYDSWINGFDKIIELASTGSPKLKEWSDSLELANDKYAATGNVDDYNKSLSELAKTISSELDLDYDTVLSGLENMVKPLSEAERSLNSFLESFGSSRLDLLNGDSFAEQLAEQFKGVDDIINKMNNNKEYAFKANGTLSFDMMTDIANKDEIPDQIQNLANEFAKGGVTKAESDMMLEIMMAIKSGDKAKIDETINDVNTKLKEMGLEEHVIDIETLFDETGTAKAKESIDNLKNEDGTINKQLIIDTHGEEKAKQMMEAIDLLESRPDVEKAVSAVVEGEDDLIFFSEIIKNLPVNAEYTNKFIVDNAEALSKMENYQEVLDFINSQPKEWRVKYGFDADGVEVTKENIESVNKAIDEGNGKEFTVQTNNENVLDTIEDIETLVKMSSEVENGKYKLDIEANTEQAVTNLKNLETGLSNLSTQMGSMKQAKISIETATAAKNISGLMVRVKEYKTATSSIKSIVFKSETAQSAKNISGLLNRVKEYQTAASSIKTLVFKSETAQAAKNISGLIAKVGEYNKVNPKTLTFKTNASSITGQVNSLANAVRKVPNGKTINYSIKTTGKVPSLPSGRGIPANNIQAQTLAIQQSVQDGMGAINDFNSTSISPFIETPIARRISPSEANDYFKFDVDAFKKLEISLKKISNELDIISKRADKAFGREKIGYLENQIELLKKQQQLQHILAEDMRVQQDALKNFIMNKGFTIDNDDNITNYSEKLLAYEKHIKSLEERLAANKSGNNDKLQAEYDASKKSLDEIKKALQEYLNLTFDKIPASSKEWLELSQSIKDAEDAIKKAQIALKYAADEVNIGKYEGQVDALTRKIMILDKQISFLNGQDKVNAMNKKIELLKKQQEETHKLAEAYRKVEAQVKSYLETKGFTFDTDGDISNLENLGSFIGTETYEEIKKVIEEYQKLHNDIIPGLSADWADMEVAIDNCVSEVHKLELALKNMDAEIAIGKFEAALKRIQTEIMVLDKAIDKAFGSQKEELLRKKIELLKQEQAQLHNTANAYREMAKVYAEYLSGAGFTFDSNGDISNLEHIKDLMDDPKFEAIKDALQEYINITQNKIPGLQSDWQGLQGSIEDCNDAIEQARKELEKFIKEAKIESLLDKFNDLGHEISVLDKLMEHAFGKDKLDLMNKKLELLKQQQIELQKHYEFFNAQKAELQSILGQNGFTFDADGNITNYVEQLEQLGNTSTDIEDLKDKLEEYLDIQDNKLPGIVEDWLDLENAIKDAYKEQLKITKEIEDKITDVIKKQVEERKKLIDEELKKRLDAIQKEKDAYNKAREEAKYKDDYEDQLKKINELQKKIDILSKDGSLSAQKQLQELLKQLEEEQKKLQDIVQDKIDKDVNDMFDEQQKELEDQAEAEKDKLDNMVTPENLNQIIKDALNTGLIKDIDGNLLDLKQVLLDYEDKYGDGLSSIGGILKGDILTNLEVATQTMKDMSNILNKLNLNQFKSIGSMSIPNHNMTSTVNSNTSPTIVFDAPLINIEGNVDEDVVKDVDRLTKDIIDEVTRKIVKAMN